MGIFAVTGSRTGNGTFYLDLGNEKGFTGKVLSLKITAGAVTSSWELAVTGEDTAVPILTDTDLTQSTTQWRHPRQIPHKDTDGSAYANFAVPAWVMNERIKCVVSAAGTSKDVEITAYIETPSPY